MLKKTTSLWAGTVIGLLGIIAFHSTRSSEGATTTVTQTPAASAPSKKSGAATPKRTNSTGSPTSAVGPLVNYGYGSLSVKVSVSNGKITTVTLASLSTEESLSQSIANDAVPILRHEVLDAQGASISAVTGATYTSDAYIQSLQHALDSLHLS